jgi:iron complex transport system substrate-binding protein
MKTLKISFILLVFFQYGIIAQNYNRVISLAPSITKNLYYLNAEDKLIGCTSYCNIAKENNKQVVASPVTINVEKVLSLNPDLVIASSITNPEYIELLRKFNIRVEVFQSPKSFDETCTQFIQIASLVNKKENAINKVAEIKSKVDSIKNRNRENTEKKIFIQIGANPLYTVIPNTFMNDYIDFLNGKNIAADLSKGTISRESVIVRNPDYIFIVTMGIPIENEIKTWKLYNDLQAVKSQNIHIVDSDIACTPTPQTFLQALEIFSGYMK